MPRINHDAPTLDITRREAAVQLILATDQVRLLNELHMPVNEERVRLIGALNRRVAERW